MFPSKLELVPVCNRLEILKQVLFHSGHEIHQGKTTSDICWGLRPHSATQAPRRQLRHILVSAKLKVGIHLNCERGSAVPRRTRPGPGLPLSD